jgi:hypothetical protein
MDSSLSRPGEAPTGITVQSVPDHVDEVSIAVSGPGMDTVERTVGDGALVMEMPVGEQVVFEAEAGAYYARTVRDVPRQGAQITLRLRNLIKNGDAERGPAAASFGETRQRPIGWTDEDGEMWIRTYQGSDMSDAPNRGSGENFFHGGDGGADSRISQEIDLPVNPSSVDAGEIYYRISGLLGGWQDQTDEAELLVEFLDGGGDLVDTVSIGPVTPADRGDVTDFRYREQWGRVPESARVARVELVSRYFEGASNVDGRADELSLTLHTSRP